MADATNVLEQDLARWRWPTFDMVYPIDLMLCVGIVGVAAGIAMTINHQHVFRAKFSDVLLAAGAMRLDLVEQLALSGEPIDLPDVSRDRLADVSSMDEHLSGRRGTDRRSVEESPSAHKGGDGARKDASAAKGAPREEGASAESALISDKRIVDGTILVSGAIDNRRYEFALYPAAADAEAPVVYVWICGRGTVPEGWSARPPASRGRLPDAYLPRECRKGGAR